MSIEKSNFSIDFAYNVSIYGLVVKRKKAGLLINNIGVLCANQENYADKNYDETCHKAGR